MIKYQRKLVLHIFFNFYKNVIEKKRKNQKKTERLKKIHLCILKFNKNKTIKKKRFVNVNKIKRLK
jgi:hypothetical protein